MKHSKLKKMVMFFFSLGISIPFIVQAEGVIQLPQTGQTTCYDTSGNVISCAGTGQDGEIQAGALWPSPRFTSGTGAEADCMIDNLTGLMWSKPGYPAYGANWNDAIDYPKTLTLCGHSDWRLPNINELESLVNVSQSNPATWLNNQGFEYVQSSYYWSSSTSAYNTDDVWAVDMSNGYAYSGPKSASHCVWPVRSRQSGSLGNTVNWRTGQTASYRAGDDGDLKQGVSWPFPRFNDQGNGEVTDNLTGLVWTKDNNAPGPSACSPAGSKTWQGALDYVKCLNTQNYLGHNDWRLPNRKELHSLSDYSQNNTVLPSGNPFTNVPNVQLPYYWSSSTNANHTGYSWDINMNSGSMGISNKNNNSYDVYVWPVRSGQVWPIRTLTITKSGKGSGSVNTDTGTIKWNDNIGTVTYYGGPSVTLIAQPDVSSIFSGWSGGGCSGTGNCVVIMDAAKSVSATFSTATEGVIQLPQTGQTTCYNASGTAITCSGTGQDGAIRAGEIWPNPRFTDNGDQTVKDNLTGLIWAKDGNLMKTRNPDFDNDSTAGEGWVTWQHAIDYIKKLNQENYIGHDDWRLPNVIELESLVHAGQQNQTNWLNLVGFFNVQAYGYWSSSTYANGPGNAWSVGMPSGSIGGGAPKSNVNPLWPVRSGQSGSFSIPLPKTGQTICYNASGSSIACTGTGQDGELQMGATWPGTRFTDNGNQMVSDNLTGLIWTKDGDSPGPTACNPSGYKTWQDSLDYVKCLNTNNYLGHDDWRLPNRKELWSLSHVGSYWLSSQIFSNVTSMEYWSSSTYAYDVTYGAWVVSMAGNVGNLNKSFYRFAWPVRAGRVKPIITLTITKSGKGIGSVTTDTETLIWNGNIGTVPYYGGTTITLTATPNPGSSFAGWSGDCSGKSICSISVNANTQVNADFSFKGDVDSDGGVNIADAIMALQVISRMTTAQTINKAADVDEDGKIGLAEVIFILQKVAGMR